MITKIGFNYLRAILNCATDPASTYQDIFLMNLWLDTCCLTSVYHQCWNYTRLLWGLSVFPEPSGSFRASKRLFWRLYSTLYLTVYYVKDFLNSEMYNKVIICSFQSDTEWKSFERRTVAIVTSSTNLTLVIELLLVTKTSRLLIVLKQSN